ncbi:MAG TPA: RNA 2',3'-cyclic phosphodiesterase [bacterium]|nr:RNA 2',3'-cyclic phosphodiesterase [bacterium]HNT64628.1 RNA 2',3'-cyclic phosphodiesterase [bacterium]HOX85788.1 RNA 2',3'-cyclic phosphodiesterase [bacterium]HPG45229.1 RNA 2',3'-cyclic phosphodiesterase [bacterium]HPM97471.1 RNA 2',3'-cyclic phosphodiesterase [bacterium]
MRLFICCELPAAIIQSLGETVDRLRETKADVSWVRPKSMHVTLKFLGEVSADRTAAITEAMRESVFGMVPFVCTVQEMGAFPRLQRPRVYWVGIDDPSGNLQTMAQRLEENLCRQGFAREERPFRPHLTLGRVRSIRGVENVLERIERENSCFGRFEVDELVLMQSQLDPGGAIYTAMHRQRIGD